MEEDVEGGRFWRGRTLSSPPSLCTFPGSQLTQIRPGALPPSLPFPPGEENQPGPRPPRPCPLCPQPSLLRRPEDAPGVSQRCPGMSQRCPGVSVGALPSRAPSRASSPRQSRADYQICNNTLINTLISASSGRSRSDPSSPFPGGARNGNLDP